MRESNLRAPSLGAATDALGGDLRRRVEELVATDEQRAGPRRVRVEAEAFLGSLRKGDGAGGGIADGDRLLEDRAHPLIGRERLPLADPDRGELTQDLGIARAGRLLLNQLVDRLPEREVIRRDRVDLQMHRVDEPRLRPLGRTGQWRPSRQEAPHRRARRAGRVRVDPHAGLDRLDRRCRVIVDHEGAADHGRTRRADM